jgi:hypothetical protein
MLARAFAEDPAFSFIFPDGNIRARQLPRLFALLFDSDLRAGSGFLTNGGEAVTLWRAPGRAATGWIEMLAHALPLIRALGVAIPRALSVGNAIEAHFPKTPFWYLHIAGCDPAVQGKGRGGAAIRAGIDAAPAGIACYLETATEANIGLYSRFGFAVAEEWRVPDGPRFWSMCRAAA